VINFVYLPIINLKGVFLKCGDYKEGLARIKCQNPNCGHEFFVQFILSVFLSLPIMSSKDKRLSLKGYYLGYK